MKNKILRITVAAALCLCLALSLAACQLLPDTLSDKLGGIKDKVVGIFDNDGPTEECEHKDADGDGRCDGCDADYTEGGQPDGEKPDDVHPDDEHPDDEHPEPYECTHGDTDTKIENEVAATCTAGGAYDLVTYCRECDTELSREAKSTDALPHTESEWIASTPATCHSAGEQYKECTVCHEPLASEAIPTLAHTPGSVTVENRVEPTCTAEGSYEDVTYCTAEGCGAELSRTPHTIPTTAHSYRLGFCTICGGEQPPSEGLKFTGAPDVDTVYVYGIGTCTDTNIVIPSTDPRGNRVVGIFDSAFSGCDQIESVVLPSTVITVGNAAFMGCTSLVEIRIPDGVTVINTNAFWGCTALRSVTVPDSVTTIGSYAFEGCTRLRSVTLGSGITAIPSNAFTNCRDLNTITIPTRVKSIGYNAFSGCFTLVEVINHSSMSITAGSNDNGKVAQFALSVHNGESRIKTQDGFYFYDGRDGDNYLVGSLGELSALVLPDGYINDAGESESYKIFDYAFYMDKHITSISLSSAVTAIGAYSFASCTSFYKLNIPNSVQSVGKNAFADCYELVSVVVGRGLKTVGDYAFNSPKIAEFINLSSVSLWIPGAVYKTEGTRSIVEHGNYLFFYKDGTYYLLGYRGSEKNLTLPTSYIGNSYEIYGYAFYRRGDIESVVIPEGVTKIGEKAFMECTGLKSANIAGGEVGINAFYGCSALSELDLGHVSSVDFGAFQGCIAITELVLPDTLTALGNQAFSGIGITTLEISGIDMISDYAFSQCNSLTTVVLGEGVSYIGYAAFGYCRSLTSVTITEATTIANNAFMNCISLTEITIPESVKKIGQNAFKDCSALTSVTFAVTNGWSACPSSTTSGGTALSSYYLSLADRAASMLTSEWLNYTWVRA